MRPRATPNSAGRHKHPFTWVKMPSGKWQCVASHGSNVKM